MKKIISLVLAASLLFTMCVTSTFMANAENVVKTTVIDLTQDPANSFATTGNTSSTTATVEDGKLKVSISAYERALTSQSYGSVTWFPNYILSLDGTNRLSLTKGNKAIVEVKYKVVSANENSDWGAQIGIGNFNGGKGSNIYVRTVKKHTAADNGKEFTLASTFTVDGNYATKIAFAGGGTIEISSIVVHELPAANINDYAVVKYVVDGNYLATEFAEKNAAPKALASNNQAFDGWFANSDYSGDEVNTVTADATLYGRYTVKSTSIDLTQDPANSFATTGNTSSTTAVVEDGKLKVNISAYERALTSQSYGSVTWFPNYVLSLGGTDRLSLTKGNKAIVEVTYKVVSANANADWGAQIGIGNFNGGKGSNIYVRTVKKHTSADNGKEFTLASTFTVDGNYATKIAFAGGGTIEISSIVVHELPAAYINDYAVVKYISGADESNEFVKKNTAPKMPLQDADKFSGWYQNSDFSGDEVTVITEDATLYGDYVLETTVIDLTQAFNSNYAFMTTGNTSNTSATLNDSKIAVNVSAYERQLSDITSYSTKTWFPRFLLSEDGEIFRLTSGKKVIVEVKYNVIGSINADKGLQIGIANNSAGANTEMYVRNSRKHIAGDEGKSFTISSVFTADNNTAVKIAFSGGGKLEITSIVVHELDAACVGNYAVVKYVDSRVETNEFLKKNTTPKTPANDSEMFAGWYSSTDFSGDEITGVSGDTTLYAKRIIVKNVIDLTQDVAKSFATTGNTSSTTATVEDSKLKVSISAYERHLTNQSYGSETWFPNYVLSLGGTDRVSLTNGNKAIVEVNYKVVSANANSDWGAQIGVGSYKGGKGSNIYVRTAKKHTSADNGKDFTLVSTFTADEKYATKIAFAGGGTIEISSIIVYELNVDYFADYSTVKYVDGDNTTAEFAKNDSNVAADLPRTLLYNFGGWYNGEEKVTSVSGDATLTAKWFDRADVNMNGKTDAVDVVAIKKALGATSDNLVFDIDRDDNVTITDTAVLRGMLLGDEIVTVDGNNIATYTVESGAQASFMTARATESLVETIDGYSKNSTKASSDNKIVVGISNIDEGILKTAALENLTGINGDVYGLNDYKIFLKEGNIYIEAGSDYATAFAVNKFVDFIKTNKIIPAGFVLSGTYNNEKDVLDGYSYVWGDEFNTEKFNTAKWWLTAEKENESGPLYSRTNSYYVASKLSGTYGGPWIDPDGNPNMQEGIIERPNVEGEDYYLNDGLLVLNTRKTDKGYTAVRLNGTHQFKYGIMTARVKLATKNGACSTLWARSNDDNGASVNEFDFVENFGTESIYPNLHTWNNYSEDTNHKSDIANCSQTLTPAEGESFSDSFHDIALYWTAEKIVFYFDGVAYLDLDITADPEKWAAFHKTTHMVMGISAPSGYYAMNYGAKAPGDYLGEYINSFSENFALDYVRVFQK